jgi:hypothetical protein
MRLLLSPSAWPVPFALALATVAASGPRPETLAAWTTYAAAVDRRVTHELRDSARFLALDFSPNAAAERRSVMAGNLVIRRMEARSERGPEIPIPGGLVHHWSGAVLIPRLVLANLLASLQRDVPDMGQEDVLRAKVIARGPGTMTTALRLRRTRFVTVVYETEHRVEFKQLTPKRAYSTSTAIKIAELEAPGTPQERELPPGSDRGFLWRWNAYWRYEQVPEGVIVECESLSLSRRVPLGLGALVGPLIDSTARDSVERTLTSMRAHFR